VRSSIRSGKPWKQIENRSAEQERRVMMRSRAVGRLMRMLKWEMMLALQFLRRAVSPQSTIRECNGPKDENKLWSPRLSLVIDQLVVSKSPDTHRHRAVSQVALDSFHESLLCILFPSQQGVRGGSTRPSQAFLCINIKNGRLRDSYWHIRSTRTCLLAMSIAFQYGHTFPYP